MMTGACHGCIVADWGVVCPSRANAIGVFGTVINCNMTFPLRIRCLVLGDDGRWFAIARILARFGLDIAEGGAAR